MVNMETARKSAPTATNKSTAMGNNNSSACTEKKTLENTTTAATSIDTKMKNNSKDNLSKQTQGHEQRETVIKDEHKDYSTTQTLIDQSTARKSATALTNSKGFDETRTTNVTTPAAASIPSSVTVTATTGTPTNSDTKTSSSSKSNSNNKDDITPPPAVKSEDKSTAKQSDSSMKNQNSAANVGGTIPVDVDENVKLIEPDSANLHQQYPKHNRTLHNSFHHQHHQNNSQGNQLQQNLHQNNTNQYHSHFQPHHQHQNNDEQLSKTNLYIRGLNADTSDSDLYTLCNRFGSIVSTKAILDKSTNKCKGYGFVDFDNPASAEMAVTELQKQGILVHMAKQQEADPTNLYLANLPQTMTESDLENLLRPYGQVVSTRILINQNRQPRGVGFARMETKEQCDSIIALLNGQVIKGSKEPLLVKFADGANKKRPHHFQHKPLGGNLFMGNLMRRNNGNDANHYHIMNSGTAGNRNFHGGSFSEHSRQNHAMTHHDNGLMKHQQMLTSMPGYHSHHQSGGHHSYIMQQPQMMGPTSAIDPSMHYVNLANQMQGLQIGNHPVSGYMSPQQWPPVWPPGGSSAYSSNSNTSRDTILR